MSTPDLADAIAQAVCAFWDVGDCTREGFVSVEPAQVAGLIREMLEADEQSRPRRISLQEWERET